MCDGCRHQTVKCERGRGGARGEHVSSAFRRVRCGATMLPLGFRFDLDAIVLDGTAHRADCPLLPATMPPDALRPPRRTGRSAVLGSAHARRRSRAAQLRARASRRAPGPLAERST